MNFLASMILSQIKDPEDAFWSLVFIMNDHNWREIYNSKTTKLFQILKEFEQLFKVKCSKVYEHILEAEDVDFNILFSPIFITLFINEVPYEVSTRIFEMFIVDGEAFLIQFLLKMI